MRNQVFKYLDTNGNGTGEKNAIGDYSSAEEIFYLQPPAGVVYKIARLIISVEDTTGFQAQEYGNLGAALSNGIVVRGSDDNGVIVDFTNGVPITTNANWGRECYDVDLKSWGAGDEQLLVRWTLERSGEPTTLRGDRNERLEVVLNDDLRGLISHYFKANGKVS